MSDPRENDDVDLQQPRRENFGALMAGEQDVIPPNQQALSQRQVSDLFGITMVAQQVPKPRDHRVLVNRLGVLAAQFGDSYTYSWEVDKKGGGKERIEGGTIKLANDLAREYGNCCVDIREIDYPTHWVFYARFIDLETGFTMTRAFRQRKSQSSGGRMQGDRMMDIAYQIGQSKAIRNVVLNSLANYSEFMQEEAHNGLVTKIQNNRPTIEKKIDAVMTKFDIDIEAVERQVGRQRKNWTIPDVATVYRLMVGVWDGMTNAAEVFPKDGPQIDKKTEADDTKQDEASQGEGQGGSVGRPGVGDRKSPYPGQTQQADTQQEASKTETKAKPAEAKPAGTKKAAARPKALFGEGE